MRLTLKEMRLFTERARKGGLAEFEQEAALQTILPSIVASLDSLAVAAHDVATYAKWYDTDEDLGAALAVLVTELNILGGVEREVGP